MKALDNFYCAYKSGSTSYWFLHNSARAPRGPNLRLVQVNGVVKIDRSSHRPKTVKDLWLSEAQTFPSLELAAQYALAFFINPADVGSTNIQNLAGAKLQLKI